MREKKIELIKEASEEVKKVAWMLGVNDTDILALLMRIRAEGLDDDEVLEELKVMRLNPVWNIEDDKK